MMSRMSGELISVLRLKHSTDTRLDTGTSGSSAPAVQVSKLPTTKKLRRTEWKMRQLPLRLRSSGYWRRLLSADDEMLTRAGGR